MLTECSQDSFEFASLGGRKVTAAFDGGAMTSNAGALLLREADRSIGLSRRVASCFKDGRRQDRIEHAVETLVAQRIHGIALGYEDLNDHDELRRDPVLGLVSGKLEARRSDCAVLAGKSTLNRLEHAPGAQDDRYRKLSVDEEAMKRVLHKLKKHNVWAYVWIDNECADGILSVVTESIPEDQKGFLKNYRLWKPKEKVYALPEKV